MHDSNQNPLENLAATLVGRGLPAEYAERAAAELADHHRDLVSELRATGLSESPAAAEASRRLGDACTLVKKTVREYQRRYWCARWPLITFLIAPIPALIAAWYAIAFALWLIVGVLTLIGLTGTSDLDTAISMIPADVKLAFLTSLFLIVPAVVMYAFARLAKRAALGWQWLVVVACILGLFVGQFRWERIGPGSRITMRDRQTLKPIEQPPHADFVITIMFPVSSPAWAEAKKWWLSDPVQLCQFLLPAAVAAVFLLRARQLSHRNFQLAVGGC